MPGWLCPKSGGASRAASRGESRGASRGASRAASRGAHVAKRNARPSGIGVGASTCDTCSSDSVTLVAASLKAASPLTNGGSPTPPRGGGAAAVCERRSRLQGRGYEGHGVAGAGVASARADADPAGPRVPLCHVRSPARCSACSSACSSAFSSACCSACSTRLGTEPPRH